MRKLLLVILIGLVLVIDIYGIVKELKNDKLKEIDHISETTTTVYME